MDSIKDVIKEIQSELTANGTIANQIVQEAQKNCQIVILEEIGKKEEEMEETIGTEVEKMNSGANDKVKRINDFLQQKEELMESLRTSTKLDIEKIVAKYNNKIEETQTLVKKSFEKINELYSETQAKVDEIAEQYSTDPEEIKNKIKAVIDDTKIIFQGMKKDNIKVLGKVQKLIENHSEEAEQSIKQIADRNQKKYKEILENFYEIVALP